MATLSAAGSVSRGIVFTDLDGTLLDHDTYGYGPALPALEALHQAAIPVVLCSSKTRAEILEFQKHLGLSGPLISENGGAVMLSGGGRLAELFPDRISGLPAKCFGAPYRELRGALNALRREFDLDLRGFGDASLEEVSDWTGLDAQDARLASDRDFDEPFLWLPEPAETRVGEVRSWLAARRLRLTRGGRFWHLTGANDKGEAVKWLLDAVAELHGERPRSLALGDSENDLPMLDVADEGVLVERPGGGHLEPRPSSVATVAGVGPVGWARAVFAWLDRLND